MLQNLEFNLYSECKLFIGFFIQSLLVLITIQFILDKEINLEKELKISLLLASIVYIAKCINKDMSQNISQGIHYGISSVILSRYLM